MSHKIPVRNLYYLLSYAWNRAELVGESLVGADHDWDLLDLLAHALCFHVRKIAKRGLNRSYEEHQQEGQLIRGKLLLTQSISSGGFWRRSMISQADEFTANVLQNQIIVSTLAALERATLDPRTRILVRDLRKRFVGVESVQIVSRMFHQVRIDRNNALYELPLNICRLIWDAQLVGESGAQRSFDEFLRDEKKMGIIFEAFIRNFFAIRAQQYFQGDRVLRWSMSPITQGAGSILPVMKTDVTLSDSRRTIIMDAKYYPDALLPNQQGDLKLRSGHIYQLFAYLENCGAANSEGILVYPTAGYDVFEQMMLGNHRFTVRTIDLSSDWRQIEQRLHSLVI